MVFLPNFITFCAKNPLKPFLNQLKHTRSVSSVAEQLSKWTEKLSNEQISEPESSIRNLLAHILQTRNLEDIDRNLTKQLTETQISDLETLVYARLSHMPVQYIIKEWDFRKLRGLKIVPPVFIPRPETEELVSHVCDDMKGQQLDSFSFLEVGCGSGVISISMLRDFPGAVGKCFDQNQLAVDLTKLNAEHFGVQDRLSVEKFKLEDGVLPAKMESQFELIVSNPPYLFSRELVGLEDDVKIYEDLRALDGGGNGLVVIDNILKVAEKYLKPKGSLWLEVHQRHPIMLKEQFKNGKSALEFQGSFKDFCDKERFIKFIKN